MTKIDSKYLEWKIFSYYSTAFLIAVFFLLNIYFVFTYLVVDPFLLVFYFSVLFYLSQKYFRYCLKRAKDYRKGRFGEKRVSDALNLEITDPRYRVMTNVKLNNYGDFDAIVLGPPGIFVVEIKNYRGRFQTKNKQVFRDGFRDSRLLAKVRGKAFELHKIIKLSSGRDYFVQGVLVYSDASAIYDENIFRGVVDTHVLIIQKKYFPQKLLSFSERLNSEDILSLENIIKGNYCV